MGNSNSCRLHQGTNHWHQVQPKNHSHVDLTHSLRGEHSRLLSLTNGCVFCIKTGLGRMGGTGTKKKSVLLAFH